MEVSSTQCLQTQSTHFYEVIYEVHDYQHLVYCMWIHCLAARGGQFRTTNSSQSDMSHTYNMSRRTHSCTQVVFDKNLELSTQACSVNAVYFPLLRVWSVLPKWKRTNHILCWDEIRRTCGGLWTNLLFGCPALQWKTRLLAVMPWSKAESEQHACCL